MPTPQDKLIGPHPKAPDFFAVWLSHIDEPVTAAEPNKKHRKLSENDGQRAAALDKIAQYLIDHHIDIKRLNRWKKEKDRILKKYKLKSFAEYLDAQSPFPKDPNTRNGNTAEIILINYLQSTSGLKLLAFKLTFNTNVEQAIKGDDCLIFDKDNLTKKVIMGEAKFRGASPEPKAIKDMIANLEGAKKLPISLPFVSQYFTTLGDDEMAAKIDDLLYELRLGKVEVVNAGLIISTKGTTRGTDANLQVDHYLSSTNPNLVILSLGIDDPPQIVNEPFNNVHTKLLAQI